METADQVEGSIQAGQDAGVVARSMGGSMEEQLQMPAAANKITVPLKKHHPNLHMAHAGAGKGGGEAPAVMVTAPKASSQAPKHAHLLASPRACLCSPTTHAGSFRCRLHRGGAGLHEMGKKTSPGA